MESILHLCYLGIEEPLVQTQVVPYLAGLAAAGHQVSLLTFEPTALPKPRRAVFQKILRDRAIEWHRLRYHKRPALPATVGDVGAAILYGAHLIRTRRITVVHARNHVPAAIALVLKRLFGVKMVFDIRGLMADEYVDAGLWSNGGWLYRFAKRMERVFLRNADALVVLTRRAQTWLTETGSLGERRRPIEIIPCCVDLQRFQTDQARVEALRQELGLGGSPVMVYAGKFGGWYLGREMVDFFRVARRHLPGLRFLILTQSDFSAIESELHNGAVGGDSYRSLRVAPNDLGAYLRLADFAISFRKATFSQIAASPTKIPEYLAAGLPVVYNAGVGDSDDLTPERVGVSIEGFSAADYDRAALQIRSFLQQREETALRCGTVARTYFSLDGVGIPRYLRLYSGLAARREAASHGRRVAPAANVSPNGGVGSSDGR